MFFALFWREIACYKRRIYYGYLGRTQAVICKYTKSTCRMYTTTIRTKRRVTFLFDINYVSSCIKTAGQKLLRNEIRVLRDIM